MSAGKTLLLITNSDYHYTNRMMSFAYDHFLPQGQTWRDLFDMVRWQDGGVGGWVAGRPSGVRESNGEELHS